MGRALGLDELDALEKYAKRVCKKVKHRKPKGKQWYKICDMNYPCCTKMGTAEMIKYAKKQLFFNKRVHKLDKDVMSKDLDEPINAWVYLKNIGIGTKTNRKTW